MAKPIDYDALLKDFINDFFPDFIAFVNPVLFEAIDWSKGYEFLEQELINAMRGKFKIRGKRKQTDKLVKVHFFVRDFLDLPKDLENEFQQTQFSLAFPNEEKMIISEGTKDFALGLYEHIFGYNPIQALKEERQKAEEERQKAIEEERQRIHNTILNLHLLAKMPATEIATIVVME